MLPWFQYTTVYLGPIPIQVWGFFVALGIVVSIFIIYKLAKKLELDPDLLVDMAIWVVVGGFIGARIFHIFLYEPGFYFQNPIEIIKVWHGGLSSFGGIAGALVAFFWYAKRKSIKKHDWLKIGDLTAFAALFGWIIGRIGCVMIHDHMGKPCNCFLSINTPEGVPRLEMALLEILGLLPLLIIFLISWGKKKRQGWYLNVLFIYYGLLRFILDFFRAVDIPNADSRYLGLTPAQYFSILLVFLGLRFFIKKK